MGFQGFETRNLGNSRQFFTLFEASRLKNRQCNCTGCTGYNGALANVKSKDIVVKDTRILFAYFYTFRAHCVRVAYVATATLMQFFLTTEKGYT